MSIHRYLKQTLSGRVLTYCGLVIWGFMTAAPMAIGEDSKRVLILYSNESFLPANIALGNSLVEHMRTELPEGVEFFSEFLDLIRFPGEADQKRIADGLRSKYSRRPVDLIIVAGPQALSLLAAHRDDFLPEVPIVFTGVRQDNSTWHGLKRVTGILMRLDPVPTLELALRLQPETRRVVVVSGASQFDRAWGTLARESFRSYEDRLEFVYLSGLPMPQLLVELKKPGRDAIVIYLTVFNDGAGQYFLSADAARLVASASSVPVYGLYDTYLGSGIVGGSMDTFESIGRETGRLGLRVLSGESPGSITPYVPGDSTTLVDWRQLRRWGLSERELPLNSEVRFREQSLWETHRGTVLVVGFVIVLLSSLVVGLLIQRRYRRIAEREILRQEAQLRSVVESTPSSIVMINSKGAIVLINSQAERSFGYLREELVGKSIEFLFPDRFHSRHSGRDGTVFSVDANWLKSSDVDLCGQRKDGSEFPVEVTLTPIKTHEDQFVLSIIVDTSERREIEETRQELAHAGRLAIVGELTASIAHEINQPLGAMLGNSDAAEMLLDSSPESLDEVRHILEDIRKDSLRASEVIRRMRSLLSNRPMETRPVDLNEVIQEVAALIRGEAGRRGVVVELELPPLTTFVIGDKVHLQQLLLNLLLNGMEAMKEIAGTKKLAVHSVRGDNDSVEIAVIDRGAGIAVDQFSRLFSPFFTTKNNGMGLGLSIARTIVEAHGGRIWAENIPGRGAAFRFTLPVRIERVGEKIPGARYATQELLT